MFILRGPISACRIETGRAEGYVGSKKTISQGDTGLVQAGRDEFQCLYTAPLTTALVVSMGHARGVS